MLFKTYHFLSLNLIALILTNVNVSAESTSFDIKREVCFNNGWTFQRTDIQDTSIAELDDANWKPVDLPHDIGVVDSKIQDKDHAGPFYRHTKKGGDIGFLPGGNAWYRKDLIIPENNSNKQVFLHFDGVQTESEVFINGKSVGQHVNGYTPFHYNITKYLSKTNNKVAVRVSNPDVNSRWYAGLGIYRDVKLSILSSTHIKPWGIKVVPQVQGNDKAEVDIEIQIENTLPSRQLRTIEIEIISPDGNIVGRDKKRIKLKADSQSDSLHTITIDDIQRWQLESPSLYTARVSLYESDNQIDKCEVRFGIREISFSAENGFQLNDKPILLKGACIHHDNGILGASAFRDAEYRRVRILKDNGYNSIRTSHNPPSTHFLDACDELGMLVIDEAFDMWQLKKRPKDYHRFFDKWWKEDLASMLLRDRNHPSIIMWSYGNEIQERCRPSGLVIGENLHQEIKKYDTSRPTTLAMCGFWDNAGMKWERDTPAAFAIPDIGGYNYKPEKYASDHKTYPSRIMYGSESFPKEALKYWNKVEKHSYVIGDYVWTGMDYIGESGIGISEIVNKKFYPHHPQPWPWFNAFCGDIDLIGNKKPQSYYRDVVWKESNLEILTHKHIPNGYFEQMHTWGWPNEFPHWNMPEAVGKEITVNVYSRYPKVRLELNGEVVGEKKINNKNSITATFKLTYQPGELKAIGIKDGVEMESKVLRTSGKVTGLRIKSDDLKMSANRNSIKFLMITAIDNNSRLVPDSNLPLTVSIEGEAELIAAGNGYPKIEGSFRDNKFRLDKGHALVVVRSKGRPGTATVTVNQGDIAQKAVIQCYE